MGKYIISDNTQFVDSINWKKAYNVTAKILSLITLFILFIGVLLFIFYYPFFYR